MRTILALLALCTTGFASEPEQRARAAYALAMAEEPEPVAVAPSNTIAFDLKALTTVEPVAPPAVETAQGYWQDVRVCDSTGCRVVRQWVGAPSPAPNTPTAEQLAALTNPYSAGALASRAGRGNALDEVNELRAQRGLRPYRHDPLLERAAKRCADVRAAALHFGHTRNDFAYAAEVGVQASATGCAAWVPEMGWGSCSIYDGYTYGGAAWTLGADGKRYMHLFLR